MKLPSASEVKIDQGRLLKIGGPVLALLWIAVGGFLLADDLVAMRRATPEEALAIRWQVSTSKPEASKSETPKSDPAKPDSTKPESGKPDGGKADQPSSKSQNINDFFSVRKGGLEPFDPASRNQSASAPVMVADWPHRIIAGSVIASMPLLIGLAVLLALWLQRRKAARLIAEAAEAKRLREIEFKKSFAPKRPAKHYQGKNFPR